MNYKAIFLYQTVITFYKVSKIFIAKRKNVINDIVFYAVSEVLQVDSFLVYTVKKLSMQNIKAIMSFTLTYLVLSFHIKS